MDYSLTNVMNCFTGVFGGHSNKEREQMKGKRNDINEFVKPSNPS